jgi:hypothetical protein
MFLSQAVARRRATLGCLEQPVAAADFAADVETVINNSRFAVPRSRVKGSGLEKNEA